MVCVAELQQLAGLSTYLYNLHQEKQKTYINIFDIALLALTNSPIDLRNRLRQYYSYSLLLTSCDSWLTMAAINS